MNPLSLIEKWTKKQFNETQQQDILGTVIVSRLGNAVDENLRERSASGGAVTAFLLHLLQNGEIDGALVTEGLIEAGQFRTRFYIATDQESLLHSQGSKYTAVNFSRDALPLIRDFEGRLAVVALPCDTTNLRRMCEHDPALKEKVKLIITLFCGHNSDPILTQTLLDKQVNKDKQLVYFQHRVGHWRGEQLFVYADGSEERRSRKPFSDLFNLYFFCEEKCLHCHDQFGYAGDISAGDLWHSSMKDNPVKMTALLSRTAAGEALLQQAIEQEALQSAPLTTDLLLEAHARTIRGHYNLSARAKAGKLLGVKIKDTLHTKVNLWDWLTAFLILLNHRLSTRQWARKWIFKMPKAVWTLYVYLFKGIESL